MCACVRERGNDDEEEEGGAEEKKEKKRKEVKRRMRKYRRVMKNRMDHEDHDCNGVDLRGLVLRLVSIIKTTI